MVWTCFVWCSIGFHSIVVCLENVYAFLNNIIIWECCSLPFHNASNWFLIGWTEVWTKCETASEKENGTNDKCDGTHDIRAIVELSKHNFKSSMDRKMENVSFFLSLMRLCCGMRKKCRKNYVLQYGNKITKSLHFSLFVVFMTLSNFLSVEGLCKQFSIKGVIYMRRWL